MSLRVKFLLASVSAFVLFVIAMLAYLEHMERRQTDHLLHHHSELILNFATATRQYVKETLRPLLDEETSRFIPEGQSSTFVTSAIFDLFNRAVSDHTYRQVAIDPLNPANRADAFEAGLIRRFQENPGLTLLDGLITRNGQQIHYMARPVTTEKSCLKCHGSPDDAPQEIIDRYGLDSGFHWPVGRVVSATVVTVPTSELAAFNEVRFQTLLWGFGALLALLILFNTLLFHGLINRRLKRAVAVMKRVKENPAAADRIADAATDELGFLARAFNEMADAQRRFHEGLEAEVRLRTEALTREVKVREAAELRIRLLHQQNEMILNAAGDGIYGLDPDGRTTFINPAACRMLGWEREALIGRNQHAVSHHTRADGSPCPVEACRIHSSINDGLVHHVEGELFWRRDGSPFPVDYTSTPIRDGERIQGAVVLFRDVSERLRARRELLEAKERAEQYLAIAGTMIVALDREARITLVNRQTCAVLGYAEPELLGQSWMELVVPTRHRAAANRIWNSLMNGELERVSHVEFEVLDKAGAPHLIAWHNTLIHDAEGAISGSLSSGEDITEAKRLEAALHRAMREAEGANRAKSAFLSTMSHEIRTPMNAILGMAELLEEGRLSGKQKKLLRVLRNNGEILLHLIDDILDFGRVESGRLVLERIPFNLKKLVTDIVETFQLETGDRPLRIVQIIDNTVGPQRLGDPNRLRQLLMNLVGNAVKFTEAGVITVHVRSGHTPDTLRFFITDTGIGIPIQKRTAIFDVFTQADNSTTRKYGGSGLGLTICKRLVELMDGEIQVNSREGKGSIFQFSARLPLADSRGGAALDPGKKAKKAAAEEKIQPVEKLRILLAEDSEDNVLLFQLFLKEGSHKVTVAANGAEAVEKFHAAPFDVVFMDMQMPVLDGYEATRAIRQWEQEQHRTPVPIFALTAYVLEEEKEKALAAGCDQHLKKPISKVQLLEIIAGLPRVVQPTD